MKLLLCGSRGVAAVPTSAGLDIFDLEEDEENSDDEGYDS
jgi:hypothetical protein